MLCLIKMNNDRFGFYSIILLSYLNHIKENEPLKYYMMEQYVANNKIKSLKMHILYKLLDSMIIISNMKNEINNMFPQDELLDLQAKASELSDWSKKFSS
jgi:hypothetical protein